MHSTLYKRTSTGKIQVWMMEQEGDKYRTISGQEDGLKVISEWTVALPKNVGKKNETSAEEQATAEVKAAYEKKLKKDYRETKDDVDSVDRFRPMLAKTYDKDTAFRPCFSQPKLDGIRCVARKDGLWTRNGEKIVTADHVWKQLESTTIWNSHPNLVFDGELYNHELRDDFNTITSLVKKLKPTDKDLKDSEDMIQYHVYDCNLENFFDERITILNTWHECFKEVVSSLRLVQTVYCLEENHLNDMYEKYIGLGYEGQMVRYNGPYEENKRSKYLLKRKEFIDEEHTVKFIEEGIGNSSGMAQIAHCVMENGIEFKANIMGTREFRKKILEEKDKYQNVKGTICYFNLTPDGKPRFPRVKAFHLGGKW